MRGEIFFLEIGHFWYYKIENFRHADFENVNITMLLKEVKWKKKKEIRLILLLKTIFFI